MDELVRSAELEPLVSRDGLVAVTDAVRAVLASLRQEVSDGRLDANGVDLALSGLEDAVARKVRQALKHSLRTVINATGVILHTNLGRAPLPVSALQHLSEIAGSYSNLEFDAESG